MIDPVTARRWLDRGVFVGLAALILFLRILPLSTRPGGVPGPDLLVCLAVLWVLRRPETTPALLLAAVFLVEDMLAMRPPGLWPLVMLLASEFLRDRAIAMRGLPFLVEWATVALVLGLATLGYRLALAVFVVPLPGLALTLMQLLTTLLAYPLAAGLGVALFGPRGASAGADRFGRGA